MFLLLLIPLLVFVIIVWISYLIAKKVLVHLKKNNSRYAEWIQALVFTGVFIILCGAAFLLFIYNFQLRR